MSKKPYCKIAKKEIIEKDCLTMQGVDECQGCGAPTRLCVTCKIKPVINPWTGLCNDCKDTTSSAESEKPKTCRNGDGNPIYRKKIQLCKKCASKVYNDNYRKKHGKAQKKLLPQPSIKKRDGLERLKEIFEEGLQIINELDNDWRQLSKLEKIKKLISE